MTARVAAVALLACTGVVIGCGAGSEPADRGSYVGKNVALLRTLPAFPGARLKSIDSEPYKDGEQEDANVVGYGTTGEYALPRGTRPSAVIAFYRRALRTKWLVVDLSQAPSVSLRRSDAYLHVLAGGGLVDVEIDYDCYKGGDTPVCFGP